MFHNYRVDIIDPPGPRDYLYNVQQNGWRVLSTHDNYDDAKSEVDRLTAENLVRSGQEHREYRMKLAHRDAVMLRARNIRLIRRDRLYQERLDRDMAIELDLMRAID